jgi:hypothetical protein
MIGKLLRSLHKGERVEPKSEAAAAGPEPPLALLRRAPPAPLRPAEPPVESINSDGFVANAGPGPDQPWAVGDSARLIEILRAFGDPNPCKNREALAEATKTIWSMDVEGLSPAGRDLRTEAMVILGFADEKADSPDERARLLDILLRNPSGLPGETLLDVHKIAPQTIELAIREGQVARAERGLGVTVAHGGAW